MKTNKKQLTADIAAAISEKLRAGSETSKKVTKAIEKSAEKLAKKLAKLKKKVAGKEEDKSDKIAKKATRKARKDEKKRAKNATKALKNAQRASKKKDKSKEPVAVALPVVTESSVPTEIEPAGIATAPTEATPRTRSAGAKAVVANKKTPTPTDTSEVE